jgi:hypothetical protein
MKIEELKERLPQIDGWIVDVIQRHQDRARPVPSFGFKRLSAYFASETLRNACVVLVDSVPKPPLTAKGLAEFEEFD